MVLLEEQDVLLEVFRPAVVVEGEDIGVLGLDTRDGRHCFEGGPVALPKAAGEGLGGMGGASPCEDLGQELLDLVALGLSFFGGVGVDVVGLIPEIPAEDARVVGEGGDDAFDVGFEARVLGGIGESGAAGALHPS